MPAGHHHGTPLATTDLDESGRRTADGCKFRSDPAELQAYELAVIRDKLAKIRRRITGVVAPHAAL